MDTQPTEEKPVVPQEAGIIDTHQATIPQSPTLPNETITVHKVRSFNKKRWLKWTIVAVVIVAAAGAGWCGR